MALLRRAVLRAKAQRRGLGLDTKNPTGPLARLFKEQLEVIADPAKFKALLCGGRSGKTTTAIQDFGHGMLTEAGSPNLYVGQTRTSAADIFWRPFCQANREQGWGFKTNETTKSASHPNGSWLLCSGMDDLRELEKRRGTPWRRVRIDECGSQRPSYLKYFVEEVIEPRLMDADGDVWLMGTPTKQAFGYFYDATNGRIPGYSVHHWTAAQNPHVNYHKFVFDPVNGLLVRRGWTVDHPIFRREYLAEWVVESELLVYRFLRSRNVVHELPQLQHRHDVWRRVLGLDFGYGNATAATVLAYPELYGNDVYAEHAWKQHGLAPSEAAVEIKKLVDRYDPDLIVGDTGGLGKAYAVEFSKRWPDIMIKAAQKTEKRAAIEIVSDALYVASSDARRGLFSLAPNEVLHREWATLLWDEKREDIADGQDDDVADSALYAYREVPAFANAQRPDPPDERPKHVREDDEDYEPPARDYREVQDL